MPRQRNTQTACGAGCDTEARRRIHTAPNHAYVLCDRDRRAGTTNTAGYRQNRRNRASARHRCVCSIHGRSWVCRSRRCLQDVRLNTKPCRRRDPQSSLPPVCRAIPPLGPPKHALARSASVNALVRRRVVAAAVTMNISIVVRNCPRASASASGRHHSAISAAASRSCPWAPTSRPVRIPRTILWVNRGLIPQSRRPVAELLSDAAGLWQQAAGAAYT